MSDTAFHELIDNPQLARALAEGGLDQPTPVQAGAIPRIMEGKDLLVSAKTGSGKTVAFLLPALQRMLTQDPVNLSSTRMLILSPTRELARQIFKAAQQLCEFTHLKVGMLTGGDDFKYQRALLRKNPEVLVATPGRLAEHIAHKSTDFTGLEVLVLDEADRMLEMGLSEDVLTIANGCRPERQTLLFSATLTQKGLRHLIKQVMQDHDAEHLVIEEPDNEIQQQIVLADDVKHKERLLVAILSRSEYAKAVIFTNTKTKAGQLDGLLRYNKHTVSALHGDMSQDQRKRSLDLFREGRTRLLVATDVAARGLDIDEVDLVVNFDMARSGDDYLHRIGRTGRAQRSGRAVTLVAPLDWNVMSSIERYLKIRFERISIPGVEGIYQGPKKVKASGKAAGAKKKPGAGTSGKKTGATGKAEPKVKVRERDKKNLGKRRAPATPDVALALGDGFSPPKKKPKPDA